MNSSLSFGQETWTRDSLDLDVLNEYILEEVNRVRKKARKEPLVNESLLRAPSEDHAAYMLRKGKVTHFQRFNKYKRTPKNRSDFFGKHFSVIGENAQQTNLNVKVKLRGDKDKQEISTYDRLAKLLVLNWKNSPGHYKNMIGEQYTTTYTSVVFGPEGKVYACQLLSVRPYHLPDRHNAELPEYKPERKSRCWRCNITGPKGSIFITDRREVVLFITNKTLLYRIGMLRRRKDGFAADIVLKSQYPCGDENRFNGQAAVDGIPLEPVYKKDFRKGRNHYMFKNNVIYLGTIPEWIDEDFEINLTTINNNRTCSQTIFHILPLEFEFDFGLYPQLDTLPAAKQIERREMIEQRIRFEKNSTEVSSLLTMQLEAILQAREARIYKAEVVGNESVEGDIEDVERMYRERTKKMLDPLKVYGVDTSKTNVRIVRDFNQFRKDVRHTEFKELADLNDSLLTIRLQDEKLKDALEPILKQHRYADLKVWFRWMEDVTMNADSIQSQLQRAILENDRKRGMELQSMQFKLAMEGKLTLNAVLAMEIPRIKVLGPLHHNRAVIRYYMDSLNPRALRNLKDDLNNILLFDDHRKVVTNLAVIDYMETNPSSYVSVREYTKILKKRFKRMDKRVMARIILDMSARSDWARAFGKNKIRGRRYWHKRVKKYVRKARLDVDQLFQVAKYYTYFGDARYAYNITRRLIKKTDDPEHLVFFLKLIHLTDVRIPRSRYLRYFKRIRNLTGSEFCEYFNSPRLNFQILQDLELQEIYCEECAE